MKKERDIAKEYKKIREEYLYRKDIFNEDDPRAAAIKKIVTEKLDEVDQTIIILYVDCHSYRKLGKRFGMSHVVIGNEVKRIKEKILEEYEKLR